MNIREQCRASRAAGGGCINARISLPPLPTAACEPAACGALHLCTARAPSQLDEKLGEGQAPRRRRWCCVFVFVLAQARGTLVYGPCTTSKPMPCVFGIGVHLDSQVAHVQVSTRMSHLPPVLWGRRHHHKSIQAPSMPRGGGGVQRLALLGGAVRGPNLRRGPTLRAACICCIVHHLPPQHTCWNAEGRSYTTSHQWVWETPGQENITRSKIELLTSQKPWFSAPAFLRTPHLAQSRPPSEARDQGLHTAEMGAKQWRWRAAATPIPPQTDILHGEMAPAPLPHHRMPHGAAVGSTTHCHFQHLSQHGGGCAGPAPQSCTHAPPRTHTLLPSHLWLAHQKCFRRSQTFKNGGERCRDGAEGAPQSCACIFL